MSSRDELIGWLQRLPPHEARELFLDNEPLALRPVLHIIQGLVAMFLTHAQYVISRISIGHCDEEFPDDISFALKALRNLHRHIFDQKRVLKLNIRLASLRGVEHFFELISDIGFLMEDLDGMLRAVEEDVRFLVSAASILEGKTVGWVSKLAFLFLPVQTLATILSISEPVFVIFGWLAVPFISISVFFMFFWKPSDKGHVSRDSRYAVLFGAIPSSYGIRQD